MMPWLTLPDGSTRWRSVLDLFPRHEAMFLKWPPANGAFAMGFHAEDAFENLERGGIRINGQQARLTGWYPNDSRCQEFMLDEFELRKAA